MHLPLTIRQLRDSAHFSPAPIPSTLFGLAFALAVAAALRLWKIRYLFNAIHDYDPGTHALAGRYIAEGLLPYRDFVSVHPPLYDLTLGAIFKLLGYDYYFGPLLSVVFSLASVVLVYFVAQRLYAGRAGIVASTLFAVEPMMVYFGRRAVQEAMGLFLVLVATILALRWLDGRRPRTLLWCGVVLGLAVATKYVFVPIAVGMGCALLLLSLPQNMWSALRRVGRLRFWCLYGLVALVCYALVLFLRIVVGIPAPLPFTDPLFATPRHIAVSLTVFVVPLLVLWRWWPNGRMVRAWLDACARTVRAEKLWLLVLGGAVGFLAVTGYFWLVAPRGFVEQTFLWQTGRMTTEVPSLVGILRLACVSPAFFRVSLLSVVAVVPLSIVLLNRRDFGRSDCFLVVVIVVTVVLSQGFYQLPRYYGSALLFALLALAGLASRSAAVREEWSRIGVLAVVAVLSTGFVLSLALLKNYSGYDIASVGGQTERALYDSTNEFLHKAGARKVFATNPIYPALADAYASTVSFDTFALWFLQGVTADKVVDGLVAEGVDHVVIDSWVRFWQGSAYDELVDAFLHEIHVRASLAGIVGAGTDEWVEVYKLGPAPATLVNSDFKYWSYSDGMSLPLGWNPVLIGGVGDAADIRAAGLDDEGGVRLVVYEDGRTELGATSTHAGLSRRIAFPRAAIRVTAMPGVNTEALGAEPLGPAIHFLDGEGHSVILGFSDQVQEEQVAVCGECGHVAVIQPAPLHRWSEHSIDVAKYWLEAGWELPQELTLLVVLSAHADHPGYYTFHVADVSISKVGS